MDRDLRKYLGNLLVVLEIILAGCLVLLSFSYGFWIDPDKMSNGLVFEIIKRQVIITVSGITATYILHKMNMSWIQKTEYGSEKNSKIFSTGIFVLIFFSGLLGIVIFVLQNPST